jgi:hypothetical protein
MCVCVCVCVWVCLCVCVGVLCVTFTFRMNSIRSSTSPIKDICSILWIVYWVLLVVQLHPCAVRSIVSSACLPTVLEIIVVKCDGIVPI